MTIITGKIAVLLPLGLDLKRFDEHQPNLENEIPLILWNHRWEADKNPEAFFSALYRLVEDGYEFNIALAGENFRQQPDEFERAKDFFGERVLHYGYMESFAEYATLLWQSDYVISTAYQDFFGISVAEAMYCGCIPSASESPELSRHCIPESYHSRLSFRETANSTDLPQISSNRCNYAKWTPSQLPKTTSDNTTGHSWHPHL